ncbi:uncharacterized protein PHA67_009389 isoform 1-T1 [Liasis olivaceus]
MKKDYLMLIYYFIYGLRTPPAKGTSPIIRPDSEKRRQLPGLSAARLPCPPAAGAPSPRPPTQHTLPLPAGEICPNSQGNRRLQGISACQIGERAKGTESKKSFVSLVKQLARMTCGAKNNPGPEDTSRFHAFAVFSCFRADNSKDGAPLLQGRDPQPEVAERPATRKGDETKVLRRKVAQRGWEVEIRATNAMDTVGFSLG